MYHSFKICLLLAGLLAGEGIWAQTFTLRQCIDTALKNNGDVRSAGYDRLYAEEQKKEALSSFLPQVSASGQYQYYTQVQTQVIPAALFGGAGNGGAKYVTGTLSVPQSTTASATVKQTLYDGQLLIALKAAKANTRLYALQEQSARENVAYNVGATYYNIQSLLKKQQILENNLANMDQLIKATRLKLDNGLSTKTDYNRLLVNRESTAAGLVNNKGQLDQQLNQLKYLMGKPLTDTLVIEPYQETAIMPVVLPSENFDAVQRTDIQLLQARKTITELDRKNVKIQYQPTVALSGTYGVNAYNDQFNPFKNIDNRWFNYSYVALQLNIPIYDGGKKRSQVKQRDIQLRQYDSKMEAEKMQANKEVNNSIIQYNTNVTNLRAQSANVRLAEKIYLDRQLQFQNGIVGMNDVLDAKNDMLDAQNTFLTALLNTRTAELDLQKAKGLLLAQP